jgi:hypothetical protein
VQMRARGELHTYAHTPYTYDVPRVSFAACLSEMVSRRVELPDRPSPARAALHCKAQGPPRRCAGHEGKRRGKEEEEWGQTV